MVRVAELAADDHPSDGGVTGESSAGLGFERPGPAHLPTQPALPTLQAVHAVEAVQAVQAVEAVRVVEAGRSTITVSWGRTPAVSGSRPLSSCRRAISVRASAVRWPPLRVSAASAGRARGSKAPWTIWPASGGRMPRTTTIRSMVVVNHIPRRSYRRWAAASAPSGSTVYWRWLTTFRSPVGSWRRAESSRVGSAAWIAWSGTWRVLAASTSAWTAEISRPSTPHPRLAGGRGRTPGRYGPGWWRWSPPSAGGPATRPRWSRTGRRGRPRPRRGHPPRPGTGARSLGDGR